MNEWMTDWLDDTIVCAKISTPLVGQQFCLCSHSLWFFFGQTELSFFLSFFPSFILVVASRTKSFRRPPLIAAADLILGAAAERIIILSWNSRLTEIQTNYTFARTCLRFENETQSMISGHCCSSWRNTAKDQSKAGETTTNPACVDSRSSARGSSSSSSSSSSFACSRKFAHEITFAKEKICRKRTKKERVLARNKSWTSSRVCRFSVSSEHPAPSVELQTLSDRNDISNFVSVSLCKLEFSLRFLEPSAARARKLEN